MVNTRRQSYAGDCTDSTSVSSEDSSHPIPNSGTFRRSRRLPLKLNKDICDCCKSSISSHTLKHRCTYVHSPTRTFKSKDGCLTPKKQGLQNEAPEPLSKKSAASTKVPEASCGKTYSLRVPSIKEQCGSPQCATSIENSYDSPRRCSSRLLRKSLNPADRKILEFPQFVELEFTKRAPRSRPSTPMKLSTQSKMNVYFADDDCLNEPSNVCGKAAVAEDDSPLMSVLLEKMDIPLHSAVPEDGSCQQNVVTSSKRDSPHKSYAEDVSDSISSLPSSLSGSINLDIVHTCKTVVECISVPEIENDKSVDDAIKTNNIECVSLPDIQDKKSIAEAGFSGETVLEKVSVKQNSNFTAETDEPQCITLDSDDSFSEDSQSESPAAKESTSRLPAAQKPQLQSPVLQKPFSESPTTQKPLSGSPAVQQPLLESPATQKLQSEFPAVEEPLLESSATQKTQSEFPAIEEPLSQSPAVEKPLSESPAVEEPLSESPAVEEPLSESPAVEEPLSESPAVEEPLSESPAVEEPLSESPAVEEPLSKSPAVEEPLSESPAVEECLSESPAVEKPLSESPAVEEPLSKSLSPHCKEQNAEISNLVAVTLETVSYKTQEMVEDTSDGILPNSGSNITTMFIDENKSLNNPDCITVFNDSAVNETFHQVTSKINLLKDDINKIIDEGIENDKSLSLRLESDDEEPMYCDVTDKSPDLPGKMSERNIVESHGAKKRKLCHNKALHTAKENQESSTCIPRGIPKSGRWWKDEKERFKSTNKVKPMKTSWTKKMLLKEERKALMMMVSNIKEEKRQKMEELKERRKKNKERQKINAEKAEVVQIIKDPRKIKKMKRKQLKYIETRDTDALKKKNK